LSHLQATQKLYAELGTSAAVALGFQPNDFGAQLKILPCVTYRQQQLSAYSWQLFGPSNPGPTVGQIDNVPIETKALAFAAAPHQTVSARELPSLFATNH
jgi:hypothetical protein